LTRLRRIRIITGSFGKAQIFRFIREKTHRIESKQHPNIFRSLTMYAVIKTGGKQYRVQAGEKIKIEQIPAEVGSQVVIEEVLMVSNGELVTIGTPLVAGAKVQATVIAHNRADKVRIFKMRRRKHYQKRQGHRQNYSELFVSSIFDGAKIIAEASYGSVVASVVPAKSSKANGNGDDLTKIEGIGPKIAGLLNEAGVHTFADLAASKTEMLSELLHKAGSRFASHNPSTWAEQAKLAADGKWDELKALQAALDGGVRR
jgi:large subunit ribosomal protein L21